MPNPDVIFPENSRKWKWMISEEDLEELEEEFDDTLKEKEFDED